MVTWLCREATLPRRCGMTRTTRGRLARVGQLEVEMLHLPLHTFFIFAPSRNPRVLPPHASSTVAPVSVPTGVTGARPRLAAIRCAVRHDSALRAESLASALILST